MAVPEFDQIVEYVTEGAGDEPAVHFVAPHQLSLGTPLVLQALQAGYAHAASLGRTLTLGPEGVAELKSAALEVYHQDVVDHEVVSNSPAEIVSRLIEVRSYPEVYFGARVGEGETWLFEGNLYTAMLSFTVYNAAWFPGEPGTAALWKRFYAPDELLPWEQPLGAGYGYKKDARVTHRGDTWISQTNDNVWEPGVQGTETLWEKEGAEPGPGEWAAGVTYAVEARVLYQGVEWRCVFAHTSQAGWHPGAPGIWFWEQA